MISDYDRPETIEETAELVTRVGGRGVPVQVDHHDPAQVRALADRLRSEVGTIHILVNDLWGAEKLKGAPAEWNTPIWDHDLERGLRILDAGLVTHLTTSHFLLPLLIGQPGGLPTAPAGFASSESPRYIGRAIAALAADPARARWNQASVTSAELAAEYGVTDLDGTRPDSWSDPS